MKAGTAIWPNLTFKQSLLLMKPVVDSATQQRADGRVLLPLFEIAIIKSNIRPDDEEYVPGEHALHSDALVLPGDG